MWTSVDDGEQTRTPVWCPGAELNHRHCDFQSHALPTELPGHAAVVRGTGGPAVYSGVKPSCPPRLALCLRMVFSENRSTLFRTMRVRLRAARPRSKCLGNN